MTRWRSRVTILAAVAMVASCTSHDDGEQEGQSDTVEVGPGSPTEVTMDGAKVTVPRGAVDGEGVLHVDWRVDDLGEPLAGLSVLDRGISVSLDNAGLVTPATVTFPVPDDLDPAKHYPIIAWQVADERWQWVSGPVPDGATTVSADLEHFSPGVFGRFDIGGTARRWGDEFVNYITGRSDVAQPRCDAEDQAREDGTSITSDHGDTVKWCVGVEDGQRVVRVANNRRSYAQVTFPDEWEVIDGGRLGISLDAVNRAFSDAAGELTAPRGSQVRLVAGGDTLTLAAPTPGDVRVEMSMLAWLMAAMQLGFDVYSFVALSSSSALEEVTGSAWQRAVRRLAGTESLGPWGDALRDCTRGVSDHLTDDPFSAAALSRDVATDLLQVGWDCVPGLMQADIEASGVRIFGLGVLLGVIGAVVSAVLTAVHLIVTGLREVWDEIASFSGEDDAFYDLRLRTPLVLRDDALGPLSIGMTLEEALATGWLGTEVTACAILLGDIGDGTERDFLLDGRAAPTGLDGRVLFADDALVEIWVGAGAYVGGQNLLMSDDVTQDEATAALAESGYSTELLYIFEPNDYLVATESDGQTIVMFFQDYALAGVPQITTCD